MFWNLSENKTLEQLTWTDLFHLIDAKNIFYEVYATELELRFENKGPLAPEMSTRSTLLKLWVFCN